MKAFILIITSILINVNSFSQVVQQENLIGEWTVKEVQLIGEMEMDEQQSMMLEEMRKGFINIKFTFKKDNSFLFDYSENESDFMKEMEFLNNKKWKFNKQDGLIAIGTEVDKYSLMGIYFKQKEGKDFFILDESPFLLEVIKNKSVANN